MPTHERAGRPDGGDAVERLAVEVLDLDRQTATLITGEPKPTSAQLLLEHAVLFDEVFQAV